MLWTLNWIDATRYSKLSLNLIARTASHLNFCFGEEPSLYQIGVSPKQGGDQVMRPASLYIFFFLHQLVLHSGEYIYNI